MVQAITQFKTTTGKSFDTEFEAWGEELRDFLVKHGADNDAIARKIVQAIIDGQPETLCTLADIVENMHRCAPLPPPVAVEPPMPEPLINADPLPCRSPVGCSRNEYGICSCYK